ncbi:HET-domain-containing protein, partial [Glonium stellatum]
MDQISTSYPYEALNSDSREIRVFKLFPGTGSEQVAGELIKTSLNDAPSYDSLSYQWGNPTITSTINLERDVNFKVTVSLEIAMRNIRRPDHAIIIWIDGICINQQDVKERNRQVAMMRDIYSNAATVRVWIDEEIDANSPAFRALPALNENSKPEDLGEDPDWWTPIAKIFNSSYWDRLWIQQELVFARDIVVHCHGGTMPGLSLGALQWLVCLRRNNPRTGALITNNGWAELSRAMGVAQSPARHLLWWRKMLALKRPVNSISLVPPQIDGQPVDWDGRLMESSQPLSIPIYLLGTMRNSQKLQVTDPLDRVYGMLNLTIDCQPGDIDIDYRKSAAEAYTDVARFIVNK